MVIRRNTQREHRRRRALVEDRRQPPMAQVNPSHDRPMRRYSAAIARQHQRRLVDLIPRRRWALLVWYLILPTILVAHAALASWESELRHFGWSADLAPLRLDHSPNLAAWTTAMALMATAGYSALILYFRRHKIDDYRGRYRVWYPVIAFTLALSFLAGSGLAESARSIMVNLFDLAGLSLESPWVKGLVWVSALAAWARLLLELAGSRAATTGLVVTGIFLTTSEVGRFVRWPSAELRDGAQMLLVLASALAGLLTAVSFARFIYLDTQAIGPVERRRFWPQSRRSGNAAGNPAGDQYDPIDSQHTATDGKVRENKSVEKASPAAVRSKAQTPDSIAAPQRIRLPRFRWRFWKKADADEAAKPSETTTPKQTVKTKSKTSSKTKPKSSEGPRQPSAKNSASRDWQDTDATVAGPNSESSAGALSGRVRKAAANSQIDSRSPASESPVNEADNGETDADGSDSKKSMSRAERRRLRKEKKRQNRAA